LISASLQFQVCVKTSRTVETNIICSDHERILVADLRGFRRDQRGSEEEKSLGSHGLKKDSEHISSATPTGSADILSARPLGVETNTSCLNHKRNLNADLEEDEADRHRGHLEMLIYQRHHLLLKKRYSNTSVPLLPSGTRLCSPS
jgi:hypothetical protein